MSFIWPAMLLSLVLVPLAVMVYLRMQRQRRQRVAQYGSFGLLQAAGRRVGAQRHIPPALFLLGLTILLVALARPQTTVNLPRIEGTVVLAFDVSGSMAADDLKPTRMEAAKAAARAFVERQPPSVQIGVVAFSDSGLAVQVPTNNQADVLGAIERIVPQRGTSVGQGILASLKVLNGDAGQTPRMYSNLSPTAQPTATPVPKGTFTSAAIVLLSDGENNASPDPFAAAQAAADRGVRIYTVGIGSAGGTTLHVNGFTVHTQLDEDSLQQIAQITQGTYYNAENGQELQAIYDKLDPELVVKPEQTEVTALLAGAGILVLLIGGVLSMLWFSRVP